jgi:catechol 2,3-dioxygenase-like lactoylglutathione lyase family enzyme
LKVEENNMIKALAHVCFTVKDLDASEAFYRDKLGLTPAFDFINDERVRFGIYLHVGGRSFVEMFIGEGTGALPGQSFQHICLEVEDVAAAVEELRGKGVEVTDPFFGSDGSWQAWLADPDGNRIELHSYPADSKQLASLEA